MEDTVTKRNLTGLLREITKKEIAKKGNDYIYLKTKDNVEQDIIEQATSLQETYFIEDTRIVMNKAIQEMLDNKAKEYGFDNINSCSKFLREDSPDYDRSVSLLNWLDDCWTKAKDIEEQVSNGEIEMPTVEDVISEMPDYQG